MTIRTLLLFSALAACATASQQRKAEKDSADRTASQKNAAADAAVKQALAELGREEEPRQTPVWFDLRSWPPQVAARREDTPFETLPNLPGMIDHEALVRTPSGLVFVGAHCDERPTCGSQCAVPSKYHLVRTAEGRLVIVRERFTFETITVAGSSSCPAGCGNAPAEEREFDATGIALDSTEGAEVREVVHAVTRVEVACTGTELVP